MMKFLQKMMLALVVLSITQINAQRYVTEIFDTYNLIEDVTIGVNVQPLLSDFNNPEFFSEMGPINDLIAAGNTAEIPLNYFYPNSALEADQHTSLKVTPIKMDIYTPPASDTETARPVFIYLHTGNFLPPLFNGSPLGDKKDSTAVNICKQMAKRGYVVASLNYRLGWNPLSSDEHARRGSLLRAVYRAVLDTKTAVRYLRFASASYGIDPSKIALFGQGSGGYVSQAYAVLDDYSEISDLPKFIDLGASPPVPYVIEAIDGTLDGGPGAVRLIDPLQQAGIPATISMSVNAGGALADIAWLEDGDVPMIAFNCLRDPAAPFNEGTVIVGVTGENVVDVHGANLFIQKANDFGNNDAFASIPDGDVYTDAARATYGQTYDYIYAGQPTMTVSSTPEGLYPFILPIGATLANNESDPWDFWDYPTLQAVVAGTNAAAGTSFDAETIHNSDIASNPGMSSEKGLAFIDTIQGYLHPRVVLAMDLATGIGQNEAVQQAMDVYPNPANGVLNISNEKARIKELVLTNGMGQNVAKVDVNGFTHVLEVADFDSGLYILTVIFEEGGQLSKKVILK